MSVDEKNLEISFEQDMPIIAAAGEKYVIPMPLVGGTALGASLLLGRMAEAESFAAVAQAGAALGKTQTLTARTFNSPRHTTRYWEAGPADGPLMIFLHGWPQIGLMWRAQVEVFASEGWHCVAPDMRGYGGSSAPAAAEAYALKEIVEDMVEIHDYLGARPAIWVGHDWGSPVAGALAAHHAKRSRGIVLISVPYFPNGFGLPSVLPLVDRQLYPADRYPDGQWDYYRRPTYTDLHASYKTAGWHHVCFRVDSVDAAVEQLKQRAVTVVSEPHDVVAMGLRVAFFADPWGNLFEFTQPLGNRS